jgi:hypothetical protein
VDHVHRGRTRRFLVQFAQNIDALVPLLLGVTVSALALFDLASPKVVDNSILIALSVLSFALLRDRWNSEKSDGTLQELREKLPLLSELDQLVTGLNVTVEGMATIRTVKGPERDRAFVEARLHTDRWTFKGGTGTYTRAVTLPQCVQSSRLERRALTVRLEILDPMDESLCGQYARYRSSLAQGPDGTGEVWTTDRTRKESFATVLAACWYQQNFQLLDIGVGLSQMMSTFRFDLSADRVIITQDDPQFPAVVIVRNSSLYDGYATELRTSFGQSRQVDLLAAGAVTLSDIPTETQVRQLFEHIAMPLPADYGSTDVQQIVNKAIDAKNPYG